MLRAVGTGHKSKTQHGTEQRVSLNEQIKQVFYLDMHLKTTAFMVWYAEKHQDATEQPKPFVCVKNIDHQLKNIIAFNTLSYCSYTLTNRLWLTIDWQIN